MNDTITIQRADARKAYERALSGAKLENVLEDLLGKDNIKPLHITERVKTFEDACEVLGIQPDGVLSVLSDPDSETLHIEAFIKLGVIAKALNLGENGGKPWTPDWSDSSQPKYYPWFQNTGSGFSFADYGHISQYSTVGSRLCFKTSKLAEYAGKQFIELYNQFLGA